MILSIQFKLKDCTVWKTVCETNIKGGAVGGGGNLTVIFLRGNGPFQLCLKYTCKVRRPDLFWS